MKRLTLAVLLFCLFIYAAEEETPLPTLFLTGDTLYMTTREDGIAFAKGAKAGNLDSAWNLGFRAGLGVWFSHDGWNALFSYMRLGTHSHGALDIPASPTWDIGGVQGILQDNAVILPTVPESSADLDLLLRRFNLEIGKPITATPYLILEPTIGFAALWHKQHYAAHYPTTLRVNHDLWGIGIRTTLQSHFAFNTIYGLFADTGIAALWERVRVHRIDAPVNTTNDFHIAHPLIDLAFGIEFNPLQYQGLHGRIGWEIQLWMGQSYFQNLPDRSCQGDLILNGFFAGLAFHF